MRFRYSVFIAFLITAFLLVANAYQVTWLDDPFIKRNTVNSQNDSFNELAQNTLLDKSRFSQSLASVFSFAALEDSYKNFPVSNICIEAFAFQESKYNQIPVIALNPNNQLIPASVMKYITAVVVLETFQANDRLTTQLLTDENGPNISNAYIQTSGDPSFVSQVGPVPRRADYLTPKTARTFNEFAKNIRAANIKSIGTLHIDNKWFQIPSVESGWSSDRGVVGQLAALNSDEGFENNVLAKDADQSTAELLQRVLLAHGVEVRNISFEKIPQDLTNVVAETKSDPIVNLVVDMLATSNNVYAEQLLAAATKVAKNTVTLQTRSEHVNEVLNELLGGTDGFQFANGSGYTRQAKLSCSFINKLIRTYYEKSEVDISDFSSIAGESGTLTQRFSNFDETIEAKTGTLNGVTALSGKVSDSLLFSFIANGSFSQSEGFKLQEQALRPLADFPKIEKLDL